MGRRSQLALGLHLFFAALALGTAGCGHAASSRSGILFLSDRDGDWALRAMDANGGNNHRVLPAGQVDPFGEGLGYGEPLVSPDGRKALLARDGVSVVSLATGASKRVSAGEEGWAAWAPDSNRIVFSGHEGVGLYVVDLRSGRKRTLLSTSQTFAPAWSPDGKWIAFARQIGYGPTELYVSHPDGSGLSWVSEYAPTAERGLSWSRDGRLAFIGRRGSNEFAQLVVVDVRTRRVHVVARRLGDGTAAWSPDGATIAYAATAGESNASAIYTVNADGRGRRRLTPRWPPSSDASPVWSPDGKTLLFVSALAGGGAERYVPEVWTMHADGSDQRPLTSAYPDGGENVEPAWIRGAVHAEVSPRPQEVRHGQAVVLRVPFPVDGIAADDDHAAIAPVAYEMQRETQPTPPILLWHPGQRKPTRLVASLCGGVQQLVLTHNRLAFDCNDVYFDQFAQSLWVYDLRTRIPQEVFFGHGGGPGQPALYLDHIVGGDGLLAFGSDRTDAHGTARMRTLWRINAFDSIALRTGPHTGDVVAASGNRLAVELANGRVAILTAKGALIRVLQLVRHRSALATPAGIEPKPPFLLAGPDLLLLEHGLLYAYDTKTGKVRWTRRVPARAQLEAADRHLVIYTAGSSLHIVSHGRETIIHTGARRLHRLQFYAQRMVHTALTPDGIYYCFNVTDRRYPGRVIFVPRAALMRWKS